MLEGLDRGLLVKGREWGNCVLTADCVTGFDRGLERREWVNCDLTADCVRGIG